MKHGFVQTNTHGRVHDLEQGAATGQVLMLLHSNRACAFQYEDVMIADPATFVKAVNRLLDAAGAEKKQRDGCDA